jgi:hypothetical protein
MKSLAVIILIALAVTINYGINQAEVVKNKTTTIISK